jgi:hypothetical protein
LLSEGEFVLASDLDISELGRRVVYALAAGRTKVNEIEQVVRTDPTRTLGQERTGLACSRRTRRRRAR